MTDEPRGASASFPSQARFLPRRGEARSPGAASLAWEESPVQVGKSRVLNLSVGNSDSAPPPRAHAERERHRDVVAFQLRATSSGSRSFIVTPLYPSGNVSELWASDAVTWLPIPPLLSPPRAPGPGRFGGQGSAARRLQGSLSDNKAK